MLLQVLAAVRGVYLLSSCTNSLSVQFSCNIKNNRTVKGVNEFLMVFMTLPAFTTYSIGKSASGPIQGNKTIKIWIRMIYNVLGRFWIGKRRPQPLSKATKAEQISCFIISENVYLEKRECGRSQTQQKPRSPDFTELHWTSPDLTRLHRRLLQFARIHRNCIEWNQL